MLEGKRSFSFLGSHHWDTEFVLNRTGLKSSFIENVINEIDSLISKIILKKNDIELTYLIPVDDIIATNEWIRFLISDHFHTMKINVKDDKNNKVVTVVSDLKGFEPDWYIDFDTEQRGMFKLVVNYPVFKNTFLN